MSTYGYQHPVNISVPPPPHGLDFSVPPPPLCCLPSPPMPTMSVPMPMSAFSAPPPPTPLQSSALISPAMSSPMQQPQQRRPDPGYESEDKDSDSNSIQAQSPSRAASPCDSARPESPDADASQLAEDLAGFRIAGPRPVDMALSQQMEIVWHERFVDFFSRFSFGSWHLFPVFDPPDVDNTGIPRNQWRYFKDQAKVRFICYKCQKAWTSMGGQVVFWVYKDDAKNEGYVHFKLYGQKCTDCNSQYYEHAIWYQEEVEKVIENLYHQVGHLYYGMPAHRKRVDRRMGHPKKEHNSATCQACRDRVCRMGQLQKRKSHGQQQQKKPAN
ncbi:hypothetical protein BOX15_Mlig033475g1 [Macrostomum lignano]|uniref:Uncharacterized protein n=2 Tax=Macrostomum lignano TaxID=282301 RepID=A0A267G7L5_9PLAT|nr:hypothetical protein BOX15_Mlig033475g1 [Macrostomum lignano]